jgi:uncharacterized RDD family membrane protein YckC
MLLEIKNSVLVKNMDNQNYSTAAASPDLFVDEPLTYAGFGDRFGAALLDGLILMIPNIALIHTIKLEGSLSTTIPILLAWLYFALQESSAAKATFGKKILGIKVMTMEGQRISFGQATGRHFGKILSCFILLIGYLMMLWDEKSQTLHDKMASTLVVKNNLRY